MRNPYFHRAMAIAITLVLTASAQPQTPSPASHGTSLAGENQATPIRWTPRNLRMAEGAGAMQLTLDPEANGVAESQQLSLVPLHQYTLTLTCSRSPGLGLTFRVKWLDAARNPGSRQIVWQLPDRFRPDYWPLSPYKTTYAQRFCLPPAATQVTLQIAMVSHPETPCNSFELDDLTLAQGEVVPFGSNLGPNLCCFGDMENAGTDGMALGWTFWGANPDAKLLESDPPSRAAHGGRRFLAFPAGKNCILAGRAIPIEPGRAYRLSFWARGTGDLSVGAHALEPTRGQRVGDPQQTPFHVESSDWQPLSFVWFAEALHAAEANPFFGVNPRTELHLDDVTFQQIEP